MQKRVLVFGTFDCLHAGHRYFFKEARALGTELLVVVTRDSVIVAMKGRDAIQTQEQRLATVRAQGAVSWCQLGAKKPDDYTLLHTLDFEVLAIGYDQSPTDVATKALLIMSGKPDVPVVRLKAYKPKKYKSSLLRRESQT